MCMSEFQRIMFATCFNPKFHVLDCCLACGLNPGPVRDMLNRKGLPEGKT